MFLTANGQTYLYLSLALFLSIFVNPLELHLPAVFLLYSRKEIDICDYDMGVYKYVCIFRTPQLTFVTNDDTELQWAAE